MEIALTWNLVILIIFVVLFAYNFLLGQNATIKLILSIYIAILTADGVARILKDFVLDQSPGFQQIIGTNETEIFMGIRIVLFLAAIIIFVVKGAFHVSIEKHDHWALRMVIHTVFAALSAALFLSTILIYMSGNSFIDGMVVAKEISVYKESLLAQVLINYYQFWFSLPAIAFLVTSFLFDEKKKIK